MLKLADNPPILSPIADSVADLEGRWWVAHTKARNEKALAWDLLHRDIAYFLPMRECVTFSGGRKRRALKPLFTSYLFFCGDENDRYDAMTTDRIAATIHVANQVQLVGELADVEQALAANASLEPYPYPAVGQRCRVVAGPFQGIEGTVVEHRPRARLVIEVGLLHQGVAMVIEGDLLEAI
ncbi:MAG: transcription termination/antitermination protein NusG [bacterium]